MWGRYLVRTTFSVDVLNKRLKSIVTVEEQALWLPCMQFNKLIRSLLHNRCHQQSMAVLLIM